jgi:hypothetical protein
MQDFALLVLSEFENDGIQAITHSADGQILFRDIGPLIQPIGLGKQFLCLLESYAALWICPKALALSRIKAENALI